MYPVLLFCMMTPCLGLQSRHPVLIIPAFGGSSLQQTTSTSISLPLGCQALSIRKLWFDLANFIAPVCSLYKVKLNYDRRRRTSIPNPGVRVRVVSDIPGILSVAPPLPELAADFDVMVSSLQVLGYMREQDLRAAPYDWRYSINGLGRWMKETKRKIESMYTMNGNKSVIIVTCSIGSINTYVFLKKQSPSWNNKYIRSLILMSSPFGGSFRFVHLYFTVNEVLLPVFTPAQRSFPVCPFLLPRPAVAGRRVLVTTSSKQYTASDYQTLFSDLNRTDSYFQFEDAMKAYDGNNISSPGDMSIYCMMGVGSPTRASAFIPGRLAPYVAGIQYTHENGDMVVGLPSLTKCNDLGKGKKNFASISFPGVTHGGIVRDPIPVAVVTSIINSINDGTESFSRR